ncbi:hypothetical protein E4U14_000332 [Claviceps sp. LM454 group G7]|nr:hypothetical protein E4U14_000332 [Claviceps sp. LM454 group G7]
MLPPEIRISSDTMNQQLDMIMNSISFASLTLRQLNTSTAGTINKLGLYHNMSRFQEIWNPDVLVSSVPFGQGSADAKCDKVRDLTATEDSTDFNDAFCRGKDLSFAGFFNLI